MAMKTNKQSEPTSGHGGNVYRLARQLGCAPEEIIDFSVSINPLGFPEGVRPAINRALDMSVNYPDTHCTELAKAIADVYGCPVERVIIGNGTTEILHLLPQALGRKRALIPTPAYIGYERSARLGGMTISHFELTEADAFAVNWARLGDVSADGDLIYLARPNNPTGTWFETDDLLEFARNHPKCTFIVDEAYADFAKTECDLLQRVPDNVIVIISLTKFYGIPGLRLGFAVAPEPHCAAIRNLIPTWSVNNLAQAAGIAMLRDADFARATRVLIREQRGRMLERLDAHNTLTVFPGVGNYLFIKIDHPHMNAQALADRLLQKRIAIRVCNDYPELGGKFFRIAVKSAEANTVILDALDEILAGQVPKTRRRICPALMIQGTASNAGKSVLAAAFCRILRRRGVDVAPFKAQNMSLNSFVTIDGLEMGRAQVVQAQASRLEPDVRMNPILLKPSSDVGCQVIVDGRSVGNMSVEEYIAYKETAFQSVTDSYDALAAAHEVMVLEGAGSPGEVNLKSHDLVNMRMAKYADAKVLLAGDIDRGGVFASFIGTMNVLAQWERNLVKGFLVNRFRGDASLLTDAFDYVVRYTGRPVLGTIPFLADLGIPEEDSVEFKSGRLDAEKPDGEFVEIAVIDLPHVSNFTDFDAFRGEPDVHLRIVRKPTDLGNPDAIILPGSKNVVADLQRLREVGMIDAIMTARGKRTVPIVGICGGLQMLGTDIRDPHRVESEMERVDGLGLLDVSTTLAPDKTLTLTRGRSSDGHEVFGYEIHHGETIIRHATTVIAQGDDAIGFGSSDGTSWGTYLHGVFDADAFRRGFIDDLRRRKGLTPMGEVAFIYEVEPALERLADCVEESVDMAAIDQLLGL